MINKLNYIVLLLIVGVITSCDDNEENISTPVPSTLFGEPVLVTITGYSDDAMEPFLSRDGTILFFNNLNNPAVNTNLHWAIKTDDLTFEYQGEMDDVNTSSLEGVPTMDENNILYFVSTRSYDQTLSTIYQGIFNNGNVTNIGITPGVSRNEPGWVNFDVEISEDGQTLYLVDGRFDENGGPYESNFILATKAGDSFERVDGNLFQLVNTAALEYAAAISSDELELCFTRVTPPLTNTSEPRLYISRRKSINEAFPEAELIENIAGFVEGATYTPDDNAMYFHKKENNFHRIYFSRRIQ